jgi:plasmid stabilization system protein ParE
MSTESEKIEIEALRAETAVLEAEVEVLEEIIDLEEWAKAKREPKKAKKYRLRIDKEYRVVEVHEMTGRQILALVGKTPEKYLLSQKLHGGQVEPVGADQVVIFYLHKVERFQTIALDPTEG